MTNESDQFDVINESELIRDAKPIVVDKPPLYIKLAGSAYPAGRLSDATYSKLPKHEFANKPIVEFADGKIMLGRGVNVLLGMGSTGKTTYMKRLAAITGWDMVKFFEPDPDSETSLDELCELLHKFISAPWDEAKQGLIIDSFKAVVYSKGNLGKGGINASVHQELTNLSAAAAKAGKIIVASVNLTTKDEAVYQSFDEALVSSINGAILFETGYVTKYRVRDYVSGERHEFSNHWDEYTNQSGDTSVGPEFINSYTSSANDALDKALNQATRRLGRVDQVLR